MIKNHFVGRNAGSGLGLQMLSEEDKQLIHSAALEVLSQTGMLIDDKECCEVLADIGCEVDFEKRLSNSRITSWKTPFGQLPAVTSSRGKTRNMMFGWKAEG